MEVPHANRPFISGFAHQSPLFCLDCDQFGSLGMGNIIQPDTLNARFLQRPVTETNVRINLL
jgi:hypothetical protein